MFTADCKVDSSEDPSNGSLSDVNLVHVDKPTTSNHRIKVFTVYAADTNKVTPTTASIALYFYFSGRIKYNYNYSSVT